MKAPSTVVRFLQDAWQRKGLTSALLSPLSWLTCAVLARKHRRYRRHPNLVQHSRLPVVVVGNIYIGGTGKTPVVIALVRALQAQGWHPGVISRGYGVKVGPRPRSARSTVNPKLFGDEPALISQVTHAPIAVHPRRVLALRKLQKNYPEIDVVIADDGLQHLELGRDIEIVVQDGRGVGNGRVLPAGPLREPARRLESVDFIITNLQLDQKAPEACDTLAKQITMRLVPTKVVHLATGAETAWDEWKASHQDRRLAAVAGIGQPERFFAMLRYLGISLANAIALPDHDDYDSSPFAGLTEDCILVTAKDEVKCKRFGDERVWAVHVEPVFSDDGWLEQLSEMLEGIAKRKQTVATANDRH